MTNVNDCAMMGVGGERMVRLVRLEIEVETTNAKHARAWWGEVTPAVVGEGSGRRVTVKGDPRWLPRPEARGRVLAAWVERPAGAFIRAGGQASGGYRLAKVASPVLVVEEGAEWEGWDRDGTRSVTVRVRGARPLTLEEAERLFQSETQTDDED